MVLSPARLPRKIRPQLRLGVLHALSSEGAGVRVVRSPFKRYYGRDDLHFVTFSFYRRKPHFGTRAARDRFWKIPD
jgi:hypothetical protein